MSYGLVVCSYCNREIHQDGPDHTWRHCEDKTPRCIGAAGRYPATAGEIVGTWCGADDFDGVFRNARKKAKKS